MNRCAATRVALLAATSVSALAFASPAVAGANWVENTYAASEATLDFSESAQVLSQWGENLDVVGNHTITPGTPVVPVYGDPRRGNPQPPITSNPLPGVPLLGSDIANSPQLLSSGITGVGQSLQLSPGGGLGLCSGTLINPRTVISAAHCYYGTAHATNPALRVFRQPHEYGAKTGTLAIPLAYAFNASNRNQCGAGAAGTPIAGQQVPCYPGADATVKGAYETWRDSADRSSIPSMNIFNANQVWFDTSVHPNAGGEFANKDIALVTLDRHAKGIPTWTMLFSPLDGPTHATITGYGGTGSGQYGALVGYNIDYRRRSAENMIDALISANNFWNLADKSPTGANNHAAYWMDFDGPGRPATGADLDPTCYFVLVRCTDFGGLGGHGPAGQALPNEATTAGGDSGGPLIADTRFHKPVVIGVLTGSYSYTQGRSFYGQFNLYPPLFQFWEEIVQNNPYKYVSAKAGDGNWEDEMHWIQDMDPNYGIIGPDGQLANSLPNYNQGGADGAVEQFGTVCALTTTGVYNFANFQASYGQCTDFESGTNPTGVGGHLVVAGGPGSTNFVPHNVEPSNTLVSGSGPTAVVNTVKAKYYDVTLREAGKTTLSSAATIDKLTIDGSARLNIATAGDLKVWSDFTQDSGWTNIDGKLTADEAFVWSGLLSGKGVFDPSYLTVAAGAVAPGGGDKVGTFTVKADTVLASASSLFVDVARNGADKLVVEGVLSLSSPDDDPAERASVVFNKVTDAPAPRHGQKYTIATATGNVQGTFLKAYTFQGVLRPELTYIDTSADADTLANEIVAEMRAGSLVEILDGGNATEIAFASALDQLRNGFYDKLYNLYGNVDWMNAGQLAATFSALSPVNMVGEVRAMQDRQSQKLLGNVGDRLSLMGTGRAQGISFVGGASALEQSREGLSASAQLGLTEGQAANIAAPGGLSGFVAMGGDTIGSTYGDADRAGSGQHSRYFASGIEAPFGDAMVGTAIGYAETRAMIGQDEASTKLTQAAAYASLPVGKSAYVGGVVAAERAQSDSNRLTTDTTSMFRLSGATHSARYMANLEAGVRKAIGSGLYLNPRAQLGFSHYALGGFREAGGETALALDTLKVNRIESRFGAKLDGATSIGKWSVRPSLQADYVRLLSGANAGLNVAFAAAPEHSFALPLTGGGSGWMEMKGGVEMTRGKFSLGLTGQATAGDAPLSDQRGAVEMKLRF
ncbi:autotransporter domain-containing protein [Sphingomonas lutea]|uniref:autotransporter domain-containing protein n=1 Tax=Sphingomonas lutea TaxID=1045317 RepID=UPI0031E755B0